MRPILTTSALLLLLAPPQANAFVPMQTRAHHIQQQHQPITMTLRNARGNIVSRQMVMDSPDPMDMNMNMNTNMESKTKKTSTDPTPFFVSLLQNMNIEDKMQMKVAAVALGLAMAVTMMPLQADAAMSGGRMGGSYSAPRQSMSRPAPSSSYNRGYSSGYTSGYYSRPSVTIAPSIGYGYNPFFGFGGGYGYYGGGPGVISVARGPSLFDLVLFGGILFAIANVIGNVGTGISSSTGMSWADTSREMPSALGAGTDVVQLSVALEVPNRDDPNSILSILNKLSQTASTDSRMGIQNLTSQVAIELLRRKSSIVSASSDYQHFGDRSKAGREYESRSIKERSKFERESISKYGGVDYSTRQNYQIGASSNDATPKATMAVITIVAAIDGDSTKIPKINSLSSVEEALRMIAANAKVDDCLQSVEILWTPEERTETLSVRDVIADYPELRSV